MKIGINIQFIDQFVGMGTVIRELLKQFNARYPQHEYFLYYDKKYNNEFKKIYSELELNTEKFTLRIIPVNFGQPRSIRNKFIWEKFTLPKQAKKDKLNIFFSPYPSLSVIKFCPHIMAVYDMYYKGCPPKNFHKDYGGRFYYYLIYQAAKKANQIITISENSKKEISQFLNISLEKITNISCGKNNIYRQTSESEKQEYWQNLQSKFKIKKPYFYYIGSREPRKNLERIIQAFAKLSHTQRKPENCHPELVSGSPDKPENYDYSNYNLVLTGANDISPEQEQLGYTNVSKLAKKYNIENKIFQIGHPSLEQNFKLLTNAHTLVWPTLYEGFGLPPLEAMASECPVITSNTSSLPEVVGNAALTVDPTNEQQILQAMKKLIDEENFRNQLIEKGYKQAKKFTWEKTADKLMNLIQKTR